MSTETTTYTDAQIEAARRIQNFINQDNLGTYSIEFAQEMAKLFGLEKVIEAGENQAKIRKAVNHILAAENEGLTVMNKLLL